MTTRLDMRAQMKSETDRSDANIDTKFNYAINSAIKLYQPTRFYFNETRDTTFQTVADQKWYSSSDDTDIPTFVRFDALYVYETNGQVYQMERIKPELFEKLSDNSAARGRPYAFAYYKTQLGLYPIPDRAFTVRMAGHFIAPAPEDDEEADNPWMNEAYDLIRCAATRLYMAGHEEELAGAQSYGFLEQQFLSQLMRETSRRVGDDTICKTEF